MKEQISQSRSLFQFQHGGRFALKRKCYRENEEPIEVLMGKRATGNLDTAHFLDAIYVKKCSYRYLYSLVRTDKLDS